MDIYFEDVCWLILGVAVLILVLMLFVLMGMGMYMMFLDWQVEYAVKLANTNITPIGLWFL